MAAERVQRRLAAILAADVVGYSRMMSADEPGTLAQLRTLRVDVFDPAIAMYGGRIFKTTGDGALAEFASAVDAVQCAVDIQRALAQQQADAAVADRMDLRIGISLGDVVVDGDDLYGNGVNVAARMEGLAKAGGICISGNVQEHVSNTLDVSLEDLGEQSVKNIDRHIRCFRVHLELGKTETSQIAISDKPSIAVLPFDNLADDREQEYLSDGITEDIITDMSKVSGLLVIGRNSCFAYKNRSTDARRVADDLGVRYVLEGSVRRAGARVRINAQLVDARSGGSVWAERYDRDFEDIFALQDDITGKIVSALKVTLTPGDLARIERKPTDSSEAYDHVLRGRSEYYRYSPKSIASAAEHFTAAIDLDPGFAEPYSYLSYCCFAQFAMMLPGADPDLSHALDLAEKAVALDPGSAIAHTRLGWIQGFLRRFDDSVASFEKALALDPNNAESHAAYAEILNHFGDPERALEHNNRAIAIDTFAPPNWIYQIGHALLILRRYDEAIEKLEEAIAVAPHFQPALARLACAYAETNRPEEARRVGAKILEINPRFSMAFWDALSPHRTDEQRERFRMALRQAGLPE